ncbi:MFS transporter [Microbacterium paludicola]|uniref:MFS transporter n=1 Tax=Microbacterium paludicola TaxID=300019 RepID=A0A4Y9FVW1_9MICO|nr:MFS transporter [Microbacterium paludicola]MBF0816329.1 MFS transporter [Microbacterium paludicola]TFU32994.1 MFS transporter [Microbacterium paludicola]
MTSSTPSRGAAMWALLSLAIGSFGIGMTEFVSMGLLPGIARDLLATAWATSQADAIAQAGLLISLYALGVVIGAPLIAGYAARFPRHRVLIVLASLLLVGNLLTVLAPTFETVAIARLIAGLPHGAYFGIAAIVAADLLGPGKRARGVSIVMSGLTVANVVGVPLGTWLGQVAGWRAAYAVVVGIFALGVLMIALVVPSMPSEGSRSLRHELGVFRLGQVWMTLGVGAIGFGSFFAIYSYISPIMTEVAGAPEWAVPIVLVATGLGMTVGNLVGGVVADRNLARALVAAFVLLAVGSAVVGVAAHNAVTLVIAMLLFGAISALAGPAVQTRLMDVSGDRPTIAAALNHSGMNIGNSLGAALGGGVIALGWGYVAPAWLGIVLAVLGVGMVLASFALERRAERVPVLQA